MYIAVFHSYVVSLSQLLHSLRLRRPRPVIR